jgi:hypothetical protein
MNKLWHAFTCLNYFILTVCNIEVNVSSSLTYYMKRECSINACLPVVTTKYRAQICKCLRSPGIDSKESGPGGPL